MRSSPVCRPLPKADDSVALRSKTDRAGCSPHTGRRGPESSLPYVRALNSDGLQLDWMGHEGGNDPLTVLDLPAPEGEAPRDALLQLARDLVLAIARVGEQRAEDVSTVEMGEIAPGKQIAVDDEDHLVVNGQ